MSKHDIAYLKGLETILSEGVVKTDRTGVGTLSYTGMMIKYDLRDGTIPILTTKKINVDPLRKELEWFISGSGSERRLSEMGVGIWKNWATVDGHLNYVYGYQWRRWPALLARDFQYVKELVYVPRKYDIPVGAIPVRQEPGYFTLTVEDLSIEWYLWRQLIANSALGHYEICQEWRVFENFKHDVRYLPGWHHYCNNVNAYELTTLWSNAYFASRDTCGFVHISDITFIKNGGVFTALPPKEGYVVRRRLYHDQLQEAIDKIKTNPFDRRIRVCSWNVDLLDQMQLPPCHYDFTFVNVPLENGKIETSLQLNMRSNDYCLGNPFNIAQYAILLRMVCHLCGTVPGDLIYVGTDVHLYLNHIEKAKEQLLREPYDSPTLRFADKVYETIDDFRWDDIIIEGYQHHPFIKFEVAV